MLKRFLQTNLKTNLQTKLLLLHNRFFYSYTPRLSDEFNFTRGFDYLIKSTKYEDYQEKIRRNDIQKFKEDIFKSFKSLNFGAFKDYDHLKLDEKIVLLDSIKFKFDTLQKDDFKKFFDRFFREDFKHLLRTKFFVKKQVKEGFLRNVEPRLHLKILLYYAYFYRIWQLEKEEIVFLQDYINLPTNSTSLDDYDTYELTILLHCIFKLNLKLDEALMKKYLDRYYNSSANDQYIHFYNFVKLVGQQDFFNENIFDLFKEILKKNRDRLSTKIITTLLDTYAKFNYYDEELLELVENVLCKRNDFRLKDVSKYLAACASFDYNLKDNPKLIKFLTHQVKLKHHQAYEDRTKDAIKVMKSLILLDIYDFNIIDLFLNDPLIKLDIQRLNKYFKSTNILKADLFFIIKSLEIEQPFFRIENMLTDVAIPIPKTLELELNKRTDYAEFIKFLEFNLGANFEYEFCYPLPHINIASLSLKYNEKGKKTTIIDILDESNTILNQPYKLQALFKTKLRQMEAQGIHFIVYKKSDDQTTFVKLG